MFNQLLKFAERRCQIRNMFLSIMSELLSKICMESVNGLIRINNNELILRIQNKNYCISNMDTEKELCGLEWMND
jgi:hypothetical protein